MELAPRRWLISPWGSAAVPMESKAQNAYMHWANEHPGEAGVSKKVSGDFINAQHGHSLKGLPERVQKKADGGPVPCAAYPRKFDW